MEACRITLQLEEVLAENQLYLIQALDLEMLEQYLTCQALGLRLLMLLQMAAVGMELLVTAHQVELAAAAAAVAAAAPSTPLEQAN